MVASTFVFGMTLESHPLSGVERARNIISRHFQRVQWPGSASWDAHADDGPGAS
jgi:hypothetical protein